MLLIFFGLSKTGTCHFLIDQIEKWLCRVLFSEPLIQNNQKKKSIFLIQQYNYIKGREFGLSYTMIHL